MSEQKSLGLTTRRRVLVAPILVAGGGLLMAAQKPQPRPRPPTADEALVYVYHVTNSGMGAPSSTKGSVVEMGGIPVIDVGAHQHTWFYIAPGEYELGVRLNRFDDPLGKAGADRFRFEAGKTNYVKIYIGRPPAPSNNFKLMIVPASAETAEYDLAAERKLWGHVSKYLRPGARLAEVGARPD